MAERDMPDKANQGPQVTMSQHLDQGSQLLPQNIQLGHGAQPPPKSVPQPTQVGYQDDSTSQSTFHCDNPSSSDEEKDNEGNKDEINRKQMMAKKMSHGKEADVSTAHSKNEKIRDKRNYN